jgi:hypothetical protein
MSIRVLEYNILADFSASFAISGEALRSPKRGEKIMKRLLLTAGLFAAVASSYMYAQTAVAVANVPFDFRMGKTLMPAGKYVVKDSGGVVTVREERGLKSSVQITLPTERSQVNTQPSLTFNRYGSDYFLSGVWTAGSKEGRAFPKSRLEQELISHAGLVQTASIDLR